MTRNEKLRFEAERRRIAFFQTASGVAEQLRPAAVLDRSLGMLDPSFEVLKRIKSTAERNPLAVFVAFGSLWLLTRQLKRREPQIKPATRRFVRPYRVTQSTLKGDENGYINDAKQY